MIDDYVIDRASEKIKSLEESKLGLFKMREKAKKEFDDRFANINTQLDNIDLELSYHNYSLKQALENQEKLRCSYQLPR